MLKLSHEWTSDSSSFRHHAQQQSLRVRQVSRRQSEEAQREIPFYAHFSFFYFRGEFIVDGSSVSSRSLIEWSQKEIKTWKRFAMRNENELAGCRHWITERLSNNFLLSGPCNVLLNCWIRLHAGEVQQRLRVKFRLSALDVRRNALLTRLDFEEMVNYGDESVRHTRNFSRSEVGGFQLFI